MEPPIFRAFPSPGIWSKRPVTQASLPPSLQAEHSLGSPSLGGTVAQQCSRALGHEHPGPFWSGCGEEGGIVSHLGSALFGAFPCCGGTVDCTPSSLWPPTWLRLPRDRSVCISSLSPSHCDAGLCLGEGRPSGRAGEPPGLDGSSVSQVTCSLTPGPQKVWVLLSLVSVTVREALIEHLQCTWSCASAGDLEVGAVTVPTLKELTIRWGPAICQEPGSHLVARVELRTWGTPSFPSSPRPRADSRAAASALPVI